MDTHVPRSNKTRAGGRTLTAIMAAVLIAACSSTPQPAVSSVSVSAPPEIMAGRTAQATVVVEVANGAGSEVVWSSSDESVATVSAGGLINALADGSVNITATSQFDPTKSDSVSVA